jgi:hypothetical protein
MAALTGCAAPNTRPLDSTEDARAAYLAAPDYTARRDVVIRAIDGRAIRTGMTVKDLYWILDETPPAPRPPSAEYQTEVVHFGHWPKGLGVRPPNEPPSAPAPPPGWYIIINHDGNRVWHYSLLDAHSK